MYSWKQTSKHVRFIFKMELIDSDKTIKVFSARKLHEAYAWTPQCIFYLLEGYWVWPLAFLIVMVEFLR